MDELEKRELENVAPVDVLDDEHYLPVWLGDFMAHKFVGYAMDVLTDRAIPDVRDGCKPVHRRILYAMYQAGITHSSAYRKCATTVGDVLGHFHPHGDASVYDAMVRLGQDFSVRYPLIDGHGNFGSVDGDPPAAYRYTEARMAKISDEMLRDINKDTVDWVPNFDGRELEPTVLPSKFPNLLVNGGSGIAVGMASNIPPHNLGEIIDAVILMIDNDMKGKETSVSDLLDIVKGPDFPTGAVILGRSYRDVYLTGRGSVEMEAVYDIETVGKKSQIVFTEIPYQVNKKVLVEQIDKYVREKKLDVTAVRDESNRHGIRIVVELKRSAMPELVLNNLFDGTSLRSSFSANMVCLVDKQPMLLNLAQMLRYYLKHQLNILSRRTAFEKSKAEDRKHIVEGLLIVNAHLDDVIRIIRDSDDTDSAKQALMDTYGLSDKQAQVIVSLRLGSLTKQDSLSLQTEMTELAKEISRCDTLLSSDKNMLKQVRKELREIRNKYADARKTKHKADYTDIRMEDLIEDEPCVIIRTNFGYLKRMSPNAFRLQKKGGKGSHVATLSDDYIENMISTSTHADIIFFTNFGRIYRMKAYQIAETSRTSRGTALVSILTKLQPGEVITNMIAEKDYSEERSLMLMTKNGVAKRVSIAQLQKVRANGLNIIKLDDGDEVRSTVVVDSEDDNVMIATKYGYCVAYSVANIRCMGRAARGVKGVKLTKGDEVVAMLEKLSGRDIVIITDRGYAKRVNCDDFAVFKGRAGRGVRCVKNSATERVGNVSRAFLIENSASDLMITMDNGQIIKTPVEKIPVYSRKAMGTRMINLSDNPDGLVADIAVTVREEPSVSDVAAEAAEAVADA